LLRGLFRFRWNEETDYILKICLSMVPVFIVGMFFKDYVEAMFSSLLVVGAALLITSILLLLSDKVSAIKASETGSDGRPISWGQALMIGIGQAFAVIPGLSRSGTTISVGLLCGVKREDVAQFSFLMVLVPVLGEAFLDVVGGGFGSSSVASLPLVVGFFSAFLSGLFACKVMLAIVKKASLKWFSLYCALLGISIILYSVL